MKALKLKVMPSIISKLLMGILYVLLFVTVLQKNKEIYECQEYQTIDKAIDTLDMTINM